ncbi:hypothetical protein [Flavobacterium sp. GNP001]
MRKLLLSISYLLIFSNCSNSNDLETKTYKGLWKINSITPEIPSDPNQPDCRMMNDQIFFNDLNNMIWSYPKPDQNGSYKQPCQSGFLQEIYDFKDVNGSLKIYERNTAIEKNWKIELNNGFLKITRGDVVTEYKRSNS